MYYMKTRYKNKLKKYIAIILKKECPSRFPLYGPKAINNDYYEIYFLKDDEAKLYVKKIDNNQLQGTMKKNNDIQDNVKINIEELDDYQLLINHYYKTSIITFRSINKFIFHKITRIIYFKEDGKRLFNKIIQKLYNEKNLVLKKRMYILKTIMDKYFEEPTFKFDTLSILSLIHKSNKWILHPKHELYIKEMNIYLDSFVYSKDLSKSGLKYSVNPKAIITRNDYEDKSRRYATQLWLNIIVTIATAFIAFSAIYQLYSNN